MPQQSAIQPGLGRDRVDSPRASPPSKFFEGVAHWKMGRGSTLISVPVFYYDATSVLAVHTASTAKVRQLLPHPDLRPVEVLPGRAAVGVCCYEYRRADAAPYNEVAIVAFATFRRRALPGLGLARMMLKRDFSAFVWQLPVTTEEARAGGADLWGYPKFLADIEFTRERGSIACELRHQGRLILSLEGRALEGGPSRTTHVETLTMLGDAPIGADTVMHPLEFAESRANDACHLRLGDDHPIARQLSELDLSDKPLLYEYSPVFESVLLPPRNLKFG